MSRFIEQYQILGVRPGDSWSAIRNAYKAQMRRWHPDRYTQSEEARKHAEEMTKRVNQSYQELLSYYEEHRRPPLDEPAPAPQQGPDTVSDAGTSKADQHARDEYPSSTFRNKVDNRRTSRFGTIVILTLLAIIFWVTDPVPDTLNHAVDSIDRNPPPKPASGDAAPAPPDSGNPVVTATGFFQVGSTLGEVYAIQGVPTRTDDNVWYYGSARVVFQNGRVANWEDSNPPILRTAIGEQTAPTFTPPDAPGFTRGSTREEVRAIQGNPIHESAKVWDYGQSRVYFDRNGQVSGWTDSPYNPLHIKR